MTMQVVLRSLALFAACCSLAAAQAHTPWPNADFGSTEAELRGVLPGLERNTRPPLGPRGERGLWMLPDAQLAGLPFQTTFYFKAGRLHRVEQVHVGPAPACQVSPTAGTSPTDVSAWLSTMRERYGAETGANDSLYGGMSRQSAAWVDGDTDITADWSAGSSGCTIRVAYKPRVLKDGSEL